GAGYFGMFAVRPGLQGSGIGGTVLAECEHIASGRWHLPTMRMTVIEQRGDLIAWYQRHGYRRTGRYKPFPYGDERFGIPNRDDRRFEVLEKPLECPRWTPNTGPASARRPNCSPVKCRWPGTATPRSWCSTMTATSTRWRTAAATRTSSCRRVNSTPPPA